MPAHPGERKIPCTDATRCGLGERCCKTRVRRDGFQLDSRRESSRGQRQRYTTTEKENLAVIFGLKTFQHVLYRESFEVVTDHMALIWLMSLKDPRERLARWIVEMRTFQFNVLHEKGDRELMAPPGAMSRDTVLTRGMTLCDRCLNGVEKV
jgi:RNase H-like domain found in reverse transcriptase